MTLDLIAQCYASANSKCPRVQWKGPESSKVSQLTNGLSQHARNKEKKGGLLGGCGVRFVWWMSRALAVLCGSLATTANKQACRRSTIDGALISHRIFTAHKCKQRCPQISVRICIQTQRKGGGQGQVWVKFSNTNFKWHKYGSKLWPDWDH